MERTRIAIVGGGMTATYLLKHFIESSDRNIALTIIEKGPDVGPGMAYGRRWVNREHLANSGSQEIPDLEMALHEWLRDKSDDWLVRHGIDRAEIRNTSIYPRVVLGAYFTDQFRKLLKNAEQRGIEVTVQPNTEVKNIKDIPDQGQVMVSVEKDGKSAQQPYDKVIIATGHVWPDRKTINGFYDSPWPIEKLSKPLNHPTAVIGTSLSAVDTVLTLADKHGRFERDASGVLTYVPNEGTERFVVTMFSRKGLLPDLRCHFQYPEHDIYRYVKSGEIEEHRQQNGGHVSIDFFFKRYKDAVEKVDRDFYERIKYFDLKDFINFVVRERQSLPPFEWLEKEYGAATRSMAEKAPIFWKEILDDVTYTLSFYAKYMTAEDMIEFKRDLMPLASYVIAFMPLESAEKLMALHKAKKLDLVAIGPEWSLSTSESEPGATLRYRKGGKQAEEHFNTVIRATGQQDVSVERFPFPGLVEQGVVQAACVKFKDPDKGRKEMTETKSGEPAMVKEEGGDYYFYQGGIAVDDQFHMVGKDGVNPNIFDLAMPHLLGCYPYTQSLPFCNHAAEIVVSEIERSRKPVVGKWTGAARQEPPSSRQRAVGM